MPKITINNQIFKVKNGTTILNAAKSNGIEIPTLCFIKEINEIGFCRICIVEVEGEQDLVSACNTEIKNGMVIKTDSDKVIQSREATLQLLASKHRFDCWRCPKDGMCEFYDLLKQYDVVFEEFGPGEGRNPEQIFGTGISQDQTKCVLCKRCVAVCQNVATANVLKFHDDDGINPVVSPTVGLTFDESGCIFCGQCVKACPTGTLFETNSVKQVEVLIKDNNKTVAAQIEPSVIATIAEEFGYDAGTPVNEVEGKVYQALELLGFNEVTDTNWVTDLAIKETSNELVARLQSGESKPLYSSSCSAWVRYAELYTPELIDNLATAKSPHMMQGSLIKNYIAPKYLDKKPEDIAVVSIMPCTSKKYEITREEMEVNGVRDVDAVLTVRELAKMLKRKGINLKKLQGKELTSKLADFTQTGLLNPQHVSADAVIKETALSMNNETIKEITYKMTFGTDTEPSKGIISEATVTIGGKKVNLAVITGGAAIKEFVKRAKTTKKKYSFIEVTSCPGGCLNGGGMPLVEDLPVHEVIKQRQQALCVEKPASDVENSAVKKVYDEFLQDSNSEVTKEHLHTTYSQKEFRKE